MSFKTGFVIFTDITQLDFTGPLQVLSRLPDSETHIIAKTRAPVMSDCGLALVPTTTFADAPALDLLCVPGGFGVEQACQDDETIAFVRAQGTQARYVTSVCVGAFVLGAAGLLDGKRATTHWAYHHLLPRVGAIPVKERVVRDGKTITGGGVTAGIDFAFVTMTEIAGEDHARGVQLSLEYDPQPPFDTGTPARAPAAIKERVDKRYGDRLAGFEQILNRLPRSRA